MIPFILTAIGGYLIGSSCECEDDDGDWKTYIQKKEGGIINFKPALEFDKKYGTNISKTDWKFPENYNADYVYEKIISPMFRENVGIKKRKYFYDYLEKLEEGNYFPYNNFEKKNFDILSGMVSGFNFDDIKYFIEDWQYIWNTKKGQLQRKRIERELMKLGVDDDDVQWIISPKTVQKIKKQLSSKYSNGGSVYAPNYSTEYKWLKKDKNYIETPYYTKK